MSSLSPTESLCDLLKAEGVTIRLLIDQVLLNFDTPQPVPSRTAHTALRKVLGERAVRGYVCYPKTDEERQTAAYRSFGVAVHNIVPDRRRCIPGISLDQLKTLCAMLSPTGTDPVITRSEITMDWHEATPLPDRTRAELTLAFMLRSSAAVGMPKIKGANGVGEAPRSFKTGDTEAMLRHLMAGYSLFTKDSTGRELKAYIKTCDTVRTFEEATGKFQTYPKAELPANLHCVRIEWTFTGDISPIAKLDDLLDLKPLASLFYANQLSVLSDKVTTTLLKPARAGHRRKKPKGACADAKFNRWIRGSARGFKIAKAVQKKAHEK